jgi:hypothetical protein
MIFCHEPVCRLQRKVWGKPGTRDVTDGNSKTEHCVGDQASLGPAPNQEKQSEDELIRELQPDGSWRKQMRAIVGPEDQRSIIEYAR